MRAIGSAFRGRHRGITICLASAEADPRGSAWGCDSGESAQRGRQEKRCRSLGGAEVRGRKRPTPPDHEFHQWSGGRIDVTPTATLLRRLVPFLGWPRITPTSLRADLIAGITVSLVAIPQALAYAQLAGVPPLYGLYAAFVPSIVGVLFGSIADPVDGTGRDDLAADCGERRRPRAPGDRPVLCLRDDARAPVRAVPARIRPCAGGRPALTRLASGADGVHQRRGVDHRPVAASGADGHLDAAVAAPARRHVECRVPPRPAARDVARVRRGRDRSARRVPEMGAATSGRADHRRASRPG